MQHAGVGARSIFRKLEERGECVPDFARERGEPAMGRQLQAEDFWQLLLAASKAEATIERAIASGEPAHAARYAFQLAQAFNHFYQSCPILTAENREKKVFLLWIREYLRAQLERTPGILGIEVPEYM